MYNNKRMYTLCCCAVLLYIALIKYIYIILTLCEVSLTTGETHHRQNQALFSDSERSFKYVCLSTSLPGYLVCICVRVLCIIEEL